MHYSFPFLAGKFISFLMLAVLSCCFPLLLTAQGGFTEVAQAAGISQFGYNPAFMGGGSAWLDYDRDGDEDLAVTGSYTGNRLFSNNGDGTFTDVTVQSGFLVPLGMWTQGIVSGDIDNDGYREIFVGTWWFQSPLLFYNNGDGTFTEIGQASGIAMDSVWVSSAAFADINKDGLLDLYTGNYVWDPRQTTDSITGQPNGYAHRCSPNGLWLNNGDLTFTNAAAQYAVADTGCALAVLLSDHDNDNDLDVWIANDFGEWVYPNSLYRNDFPNAFADVGAVAGVDAQMYGMGFAIGDYDHDMDLDYYVTNIGANRFFENQGNGQFVDEAFNLGVIDDSINGKLTTGWGTFFFDYDNDSWEDLFLSNGHIQLINIFQNEEQDPDRLWRNNGNGTFTDVGAALGIGDTNMCRGATRCDYDGDGDVDVFVSVLSKDTLASPRNALLYRNDVSNGNHFVQVRLEGVRSNRDAYGAKIRVSANGTRWLWELHGGCSHYSQNSSIAHFGLGGATVVDSLVVVWPDGVEQVLTGLAADSLYHVVEDTTPAGLAERLRLAVGAHPNPSAEGMWLTWEGARSGMAAVRVLDGLGRVVWEGEADAVQGRVAWDGRDGRGRAVAGGMYWAVIEAGGRRGVVALMRR